ncbi:hypothetical protein M9H77_08818 [Catharanthus roseus]|uniref:Uncharacterized protein n=1 Tax=Catharanthus roseus TaxID=4058 RepID=A0ACC0BZ63_CATRO|nr:hypothetical protein M9H77_08818 [Catharanthus roseus]
MMFDSVENADAFYMMYSRCVGLSVRKEDRKIDKKEKEDRERNHKAETRVKCGADFRIKYDVKREKYVIPELVKEHNHAIACEDHDKGKEAHGQEWQPISKSKIGVGLPPRTRKQEERAAAYAKQEEKHSTKS